ncbi:Hypothetical protein A7982_01319 [Minicystis rosea]|nr:Hypothetical protein A7982_01319 [Minicystis rosea]
MSIGAIKKSDPLLDTRGGALPSTAAHANVVSPSSTTERPSEYLGPARVVAVGAITVEIPGIDGPVAVEPAFVLPYEPAVGDVLLVIGRGAKHYAIGVLHGTGTTTLSLQGNVALHARDGSLSLSGDRGVSIRGPELEIEVGKARVVADAVVQKLNSLYQRVSGLLSVRAAEAHTVVDTTSFTKAKNAAILTEETVTVNGKQVLLG